MSAYVVFYLYGLIERYYIARGEQQRITEANNAYRHQLNLIQSSESQIRRLRHDFKNHIAALSGMLKGNETEALERHLSDMMSAVGKSQEYACTGNIDLDSLVNYKLSLAAEMGVAIECRFLLPHGLHTDSYDLAVIFGNLLDNATEALSREVQKLLRIVVLYEKGMVSIIIENSCSTPPTMKDGLPHTTKSHQKEHGVGLRSVKSAVEKCNGALEISYNNKIYTAHVLLYE